MSNRRVDGERAELLAEIVDVIRADEGRGVTVEETPIGTKVGLVLSSERDAWTEIEADGRWFIDEYEDILVNVYRGDLSVVDEVSEVEWPYFTDLVEEVDDINVGEEELRAVRREG